MQACQALFCLKKWSLLGHRYLGTSNGHFVKVAKSFAKGFTLKTIFKTKYHFMWWRNVFTKALIYRVHQICFQTIKLGVWGQRVQKKTFSKGFLPKPFLINKPHFYLTRNGFKSKNHSFLSPNSFLNPQSVS